MAVSVWAVTVPGLSLWLCWASLLLRGFYGSSWRLLLFYAESS